MSTKNPFLGALTADIVAGIEAGDERAVKAAQVRAKVCKARNARILNDALNAYGATAPEPAPEPAPRTRTTRKSTARTTTRTTATRKPRPRKPTVAETNPMTPKQVKAALKRGTITHTDARAYAWAFKNAYYHENHTNLPYDEALRLHGTARP